MSKPSLTDPDLSGLWSYSTLGRKKSWYSKPLGTFWLFFVLSSWVLGLFSPLMVLFLLYGQFYTMALVLIVILTYPFVVDVYPNFTMGRLYFWACHYFDGGCTIAYEGNPYEVSRESSSSSSLSNDGSGSGGGSTSSTRAEDGNGPPILLGCHPHGIFTIGYLYNTAVRVTAALGTYGQDVTLIRRFLGKMGDAVRKQYLSNLAMAEITPNTKHNMEKWIRDNVQIAYRNIPNVGIVTPILMKTPLFSWFVGRYTLGTISADKDSVTGLMEEQRSFCMTPGGFYEAAFFQRKKELVYIKKVKGFIKYALQHGYHVMPSYTFGESYTYWNWKGSRTLKQWLCDHKVPAVFVHGPHWWCPFLPYSDTGLHTIYSKGRIFPTIENPTPEEVNKYHEWYINELKGLFDRNKWRFGMDSVELEIL